MAAAAAAPDPAAAATTVPGPAEVEAAGCCARTPRRLPAARPAASPAAHRVPAAPRGLTNVLKSDKEK